MVCGFVPAGTSICFRTRSVTNQHSRQPRSRTARIVLFARCLHLASVRLFTKACNPVAPATLSKGTNGTAYQRSLVWAVLKMTSRHPADNRFMAIREPYLLERKNKNANG